MPHDAFKKLPPWNGMSRGVSRLFDLSQSRAASGGRSRSRQFKGGVWSFDLNFPIRAYRLAVEKRWIDGTRRGEISHHRLARREHSAAAQPSVRETGKCVRFLSLRSCCSVWPARRRSRNIRCAATFIPAATIEQSRRDRTLFPHTHRDDRLSLAALGHARCVSKFLGRKIATFRCALSR